MSINRNQINETQAIVQVPQTTPSLVPGRTGLYPKLISGIGELFYLDDLGQEIQLTSNGTINVVGGGASIVDDPFGISWDADTTQGASRNALYDKLTTMDSAISTNTSKVSAAGSISTHSDVSIGTPAVGHILRRDATNNFYESVPNPFLEAASNLSDVANAITSLQNLGGVSDGSNVGTGTGNIFKQKNGTIHEFRKILAGSNISVLQSGDDIQISASVSGEANTASNLGAGAQVFTTKSGVDLPFRSIIGGTGLSQTQNTNDITLDLDVNSLISEASVDGAADYVIIYDASVGAHRKVLLDNLPNAAGGENNTTSSVGTGAALTKPKVGSDLPFRSLIGGEGLSQTQNTDDVTIDLNINSLVDEALPIGSTDYVAIYDASTGNHKKVLLDNLPGSGGAVAVEDEGIEIVAAATRFNFTGAGVTASDAGSGEVTVNIPGGGGSSLTEIIVQLGAGSTIANKVSAAPVGGIPGGVTIVNGTDGSVSPDFGSLSVDDLVIIHNAAKVAVSVQSIGEVTFPNTTFDQKMPSSSASGFPPGTMKTSSNGNQTAIVGWNVSLGNNRTWVVLKLAPILT